MGVGDEEGGDLASGTKLGFTVRAFQIQSTHWV